MALECREAVILYRHSYISDEQIENDCVDGKKWLQ